eukprot:112608_1
MMSDVKAIKWKTLTPIENVYAEILTGINKNEYIMLDNHHGRICTYDCNNDKWNVFMYTDVTDIDCAAVDVNHKILHLCSPYNRGNKIDINLSNKSVRTIQLDVHIGDNAESIVIQNQFHIIGGEHNYKHLKWNSITNQFETIHTFDSKVSAAGSLVHIEAEQSVYYLGGYNHNKHTHIDDIYQYNIPSNKWNKLSIKMPIPLSVFGCTKAIREQYILIFGGYNTIDGDHDEIFVFHVTTKKKK